MQLTEKQKEARGKWMKEFTGNGRIEYKVERLKSWLNDPVKLRIINALFANEI